MTEFTKIYQKGLSEEKKAKKEEIPPVQEKGLVPDEPIITENEVQIDGKIHSDLEEISFEQMHIIREEIRKEMTDEVIGKLRETVRKDVEKELTQTITESVRKELETQTAKTNLKLAEAISLLITKVDNLNESLNIEIPAPVVNVTMPKTTKKINRDSSGLIESIEDVEE